MAVFDVKVGIAPVLWALGNPVNLERGG